MCEHCGDVNIKHTMQLEFGVPREVLDLPPAKRAQVIQQLAKSFGLGAEIRSVSSDAARTFVSDYNDQMQRAKSIWHPHENEYISDLEDTVYSAMAVPLWNLMLDVYDALGLDYPTTDGLVKSLDTAEEWLALKEYVRILAESDYIRAGLIHDGTGETETISAAQAIRGNNGGITYYDDHDLPLPEVQHSIDTAYIMRSIDNELIKGPNDGDDYTTMDDVNRRYRKTPRDPQGQRSRKTPSVPYKGDGGTFTEHQMQTLDKVLARYGIQSKTIAERIAVSGAYLGRLIHAFEGENEKLRRGITELLPVTLEERETLGNFALTEKEATKFNLPLLPLQDQERNAIEWAKQHAGEKIGEIDEKTMQGIRSLIVNARKNRIEPKALEQLLFDKFGDINRDLRRIALTEVAEATNNGYLMGLTHLQAVTILGADNACDFCKGMQAGQYVFVDPKQVESLDWDTMIWVGKSNYGRKKADWKPCCPSHPHCRDRYVAYNSKFMKPDKEQGRIVTKSRDEIIGDAMKAKLEREAAE